MPALLRVSVDAAVLDDGCVVWLGAPADGEVGVGLVCLGELDLAEGVEGFDGVYGFDDGVEFEVGDGDLVEGGLGHDGSLGVSCSPSRHAHVDSWNQGRFSLLLQGAPLGTPRHRGFATRRVGSSPTEVGA
jgi:hypothetical protein